MPEEIVGVACEAALACDDIDAVMSFYGEMAVANWTAPSPVRVYGPSGLVEAAPGDVTVSHEPDVAALLRRERPVLLSLTVQQSEALALRWEMQRAGGEEVIRYEPAGPAVPLADFFPGLPAPILSTHGDLELIPCEALWRERTLSGGILRNDLPSHLMEGTQLLYRVDVEMEELLRATLDALTIELPGHDLERALRITFDEQYQRRVEQIRLQASPEDKLAGMLGPARLQSMLPLELLRDAAPNNQALAAEELAAMAVAIFGSAVLQRHRHVLEAAGFAPPRTWAGSDAALRFVRSLGFADDFGGAPARSRPPFIEVDGPVRLPGLHNFQENIAGKIGVFIKNPSAGRGLVSLPTGAGKTRVATESLTRCYRDGSLSGVVLWLADRQELCEQAVQSWREVWRAVGPEPPLRISRLWGDTNNNVEAVHEKHHVVVATFQSLLSRIKTENFNWLAEASCVVIDEAHGSVTRSYTEILRQLDMTPGQTARPLLGLTATPFRGRADDEGSETVRLVNRYGARRFDHGVFVGDDPYPLLREMKVLAEAEFDTLAGVEFELSQAELAQFEQFDRLPSTAEARLGLDAGRNSRIVDRLKKLPRDWPVLLFATSVDHAELLAALLAREGLAARAISSRTDSSARRHAIAQFKAGEIQILTNYGVLTTGFDAPKTRALFVTRPIYSPGLYMQVVGRGLRGPANGGTESCLIVNVADNIAQYGHDLAFRHFEHLWGQVRGEYF